MAPLRLRPALAATLLALATGTAEAHPMGTLSTNRSAIVVVRADETRIRYAVDFAEVPSVAESARLAANGAPAYAVARMAELLPALHLSADGADRPLAVDVCAASTGKGEGDLPVVTLICELTSPAIPAGRLRFADENFAGTFGWREIVIASDRVPLGDGDPPTAIVHGEPLPFATSTDGMALSAASATVGDVDQALSAGSTSATKPAADPFSGLVAGDLSPRFAALALISALFLGAGHALSPGHGKTIVAAYLVGSRGTVGQALLLGLTVTATHVSSVLVLGAVTLWLSEVVVTASLYPWIGVASGFGVVAVGAGLLRSRVERARRGERTGIGHEHEHGHGHGHEIRRQHGVSRGDELQDAGARDVVHDHGHEHVHLDDTGEPVSLGRLLILGVTGGAVPCPSALVVLLSAIALHRVAFGMLLIVAFSVGLAAVLMGIGVLVVKAQGLLARFGDGGRAAIWPPIASAAVVIAVGIAIALQSAREGGLL